MPGDLPRSGPAALTIPFTRIGLNCGLIRTLPRRTFESKLNCHDTHTFSSCLGRVVDGWESDPWKQVEV